MVVFIEDINKRFVECQHYFFIYKKRMNIREKIGNRITQARKELGLSIRELADKTKEFSAARIGNWEHGTRSPGPIEAQLLADKLKVSASYLLCLTDNPSGERILELPKRIATRAIPLINFYDAAQIKEIISKQSRIDEINDKYVVIDRFNQSKEESIIFAITVDDDSMSPDFKEQDIIVVDTERGVKPGNFVVAYLIEKQQLVLRKYCEADTHIFQLLASNPMWATINVKDSSESEIIGTVIEHRRFW